MRATSDLNPNKYPVLGCCADIQPRWVRLPVTHRPAASVRGHVAVHLEARGVMHWKHRVYTVLSMTAGVQVAAVTGAGACGRGVRVGSS